ncbi:MAG: STAS/SEC14 domain-containing protein [Methanobacteriota archaeon]
MGGPVSGGEPKWTLSQDADGLVLVVMRGDKDENDVRQFLQEAESFLKTVPKPHRIVFDGSRVGRTTLAGRMRYARESRSLLADAWFAAVGFKAWQRGLTHLTYRAQGLHAERYRFFDTVGEARTWLSSLDASDSGAVAQTER